MNFSTELVKGTLRTIILKMLADHGKMYGYEITQKVKELSGEKILLTEGALYPALHALENEYMVKCETEFIGKRVRKYYKLSPSGKAASKEKVTEFADFVKTMKFLLDIKPKST